MTLTVALNSRYSFLDDDRLRNRKPNSASREREAVIDVTLDDEDYVTGRITIYLSKIAQFTEVYGAVIFDGGFNGTYHAKFVPGTSNAASTAKLQLYAAAGTEVANGTDTNGTFTLEIRGI